LLTIEMLIGADETAPAAPGPPELLAAEARLPEPPEPRRGLEPPPPPPPTTLLLVAAAADDARDRCSHCVRPWRHDDVRRVDDDVTGGPETLLSLLLSTRLSSLCHTHRRSVGK